jgi:hypothetical protein
MSNATSTHRELWAGVDLKIESASFHLRGMDKALQPPERTHHNVVQESTGALIGGNWHTAFYAHLDAFLSAARSVPELIRCCFGIDPIMKGWLNTVSDGERKRRSQFQGKFETDYKAFRDLPLGAARNASVHRTGVVPVTAKVTGLFGITYIGNPVDPIPNSETREMPDGFGWMQKSTPLRPMWTDFDIDGEPLFQTCHDYLDCARALADNARGLAQEVHGEGKLTPPPSDM